MPRAKPYPADDHGTHDSPWEEEASTTVEQGEVADKVRTLGFSKQGSGNTNHTQTGLDEPTVDDQHAPVLSAITPIRPDNVARLIITQGNDAGQEIELRPGKGHTIGRALDNDVVLTDIAVSRKHFDLRFEDGAWIIADRGSGNGTVVNGNVEDHPFMLASGDMIEIGNTVFRFDQPNGAPRPSQRTYDVDEEEMSTVAGKPVRAEPEDPPPPPARPPRTERPKTLPPPVPLRNANASVPPPLQPNYQPPSPTRPPPNLGHALPAQGMGGQPLPASTLPMPQMANRPPLGGAGMPTMMGDAMGMPLPPQPHPHHSGSHAQQPPQLLHDIPLGHNGMPATLPGQGPGARPSYPYPQATEIPPHSVHAQMLMIQQTQGRRNDASTAHVPPVPYDPMLGYAPPRPPPQTLTKRTKLAIAGIGLALLTGVVTAAVVKSSTAKPKATITAKDSKDGKSAKDSKDAKAKDTKPTVEPITTAKPTVEPIVTPPNTAKEAPKVAETPKETPKVAEAPKVAETPKVEATPKETPKAVEAPKQPKAKETPKRDVKAQKTRERTTPERTRRETPPEQPKRVAAATDTSAAREKADGLYRNRKFNDASSTLAAAAKGASDDEAGELRNLSSKYSLLGKAYARGTAPAQKPAVAFKALTQALNYDSSVGGHFKDDINDRIAAVAPKAAVAFVAAGDYGNARTAYLAAQRAGSTDSNLALVKQKLESVASELYALASKEANSNPGPAKEKLKQIKTLVDAKSPIAVKAQALYNKL